MLYDVVVTRPFDKVFTYSSTNEQLEIGQVVLVPFGKKIEAGIIWNKNVKNPGYEIKDVTKICNDLILQNSSIDFINWIASYTLAPLGAVLKLFLINNDIVEFDKEKSENLDWFYHLTGGHTHTDFFAIRPTDYSKANEGEDWDDLF